MSSNPLSNAKRLKTTHTFAPADKSRTGERKRGGLVIHPLPTPVKNHVSADDILQPLPSRDTPVIERNRIMRREPIEGRPSIGRRGKRASSSFENKGLIPQPHPTLDPASFHKHIDLELPEAHRARHLLVWCASRAASSSSSASSSPSRPASSRHPSTHLSPSSLPPLTAEDVTALQQVQKTVQKMLLEQTIQISFAGHSNEGSSSLKPHEQNLNNLRRERDYTEYIQRCAKEGEAWSALVDSYQRRRASLIESLSRTEPDSQEWIPPDTSDPSYEREVHGAQLARKCLETASRKREKSPISLRIVELENKVDRLHSALNVANRLTMRVTRHLDKRFEVLSAALAARTQPMFSEEPSSLHLLPSELGSHPVSGSTKPPDPLLLLRALARTDMVNPRELGNATHRAICDAKNPPERERRLTALTQPPVSTPRRPGTPRRKTDANV